MLVGVLTRCQPFNSRKLLYASWGVLGVGQMMVGSGCSRVDAGVLMNVLFLGSLLEVVVRLRCGVFQSFILE